MTTSEFDASTSSPRHGPSVAEHDPFYHATIADVTDEEHQNMAGLVQADDFNADVIVRFLRDNGIDACVDESTGGIYDLAMAAHVFGGTIHRLESGKRVDKRELARLAAALGVPLCRLVYGEHNCAERACVLPSSSRAMHAIRVRRPGS